MGYPLLQHSPVLANIRGVILDLGGVVYQGSTLLPGAREFLAFLRDSQRRVVALTNHSGTSSRDCADKLERMGVPLREPDIVTSAWAAAEYIVRLNSQAGVFVLGSAALKAELLSAGLTESVEAEYVVVGYDPGVTLSQLLDATPRLAGGATLVATNPDLVLPTPDGPVPECGLFLALLEAASGKRATVVGKPNPFIIDLVLNRLGFSRDDVLIVGDTFETDVVASLTDVDG
jgi:HAD superfamily hydrolase (TIGR01450 family)